MRLVYKTLVPIVVVLLVTTVCSAVLLRTSLRDALIREEFLRTKGILSRDVPIFLPDNMFQEYDEAVHQDMLQAFVAQFKDTTVARVTFWGRDKTILFSDLSSVIGIRSPDHADLDYALRTGEAFYIRRQTDTNYPPQSAVGEFIDMYFPIYDGTNVVAVVEVQTVLGAVLGPLAREFFQVGLILLLSVVVIAVLIAVIFQTFILRPLTRARELAQAVSGGDFSERSLPRYHDEIGDLFGHLDVMRRKLRSLIGNLESTVEERTRKLKEEETRLAASLGSLSVGLAIIDVERGVFFENQALRSILGFTIGEALTFEGLCKRFKNTFDLDAVFKRSTVERQMSNARDVPFDLKYLHIFAAPVVMHTDGRPEVLGMVLLVDDVTEERALEKAKEGFLAIASHELRTPLAAIRSNAALLKTMFARSKKQQSAVEIADDIHHASVRLTKIVHDFLDIAALEERATSPTLTSVDAVHEVNDVVASLHALAMEKGLKLIVHKEEDMPSVRADRERFRQVLNNLIGNAIHYTEKGSITISFEHIPPNMIIRVHDTGIGIPREYQSTLFKKFQQAGREALSREQQGTGLGLYISKLIMDSMKGSIELTHSEPGKGSTFSVTIPTA